LDSLTAKLQAINRWNLLEKHCSECFAQVENFIWKEKTIMANRILIMLAVIGVTLPIPGWAQTQAEHSHTPAQNPLAPFERLIGGQWHLGTSYQEFEWGVGRRSVRARSYFFVADEPKLVSEGIWFWHPEDKKIKGVFTAIDMPVEIFEYTTRFEETGLVSELITYSPDGTRSEYVEKWEFQDESHFVWTLLVATPDGLKAEMTGTYARKQ
jgi:hypothetical protein